MTNNFYDLRAYLNTIIKLEKKKATQNLTQEKILALLRETSLLSRKELAEKIGDITENGVKYHLDKLKQDGKIERVGGDSGGH